MKLDKENLSEITQYLQSHGVLKAHQVVSKAEKPGEGNMNYTLRLFVGDQTLIIKQARPYVEKYPSIDAPVERILVEGNFYRIVSENDFLKEHTPKILFQDAVNYILLMEDLGETSDFTSLFKKGNLLKEEEVCLCAVFLNELHSRFEKRFDSVLMANRKLRALNYEHIFVYPFLENNGLDLNTITPGLQDLAKKYTDDDDLKAKAKTLGEEYLADGNVLLHGDYYPGSWLNTKQGLTVIDPEFAFYGKAEFDFGVLCAHLHLAQQTEKVFELLAKSYKKSSNFNEALCRQFIGIEIIRRLIGLAQLPLDLDLEEKTALLEKAVALIDGN